MGKNLFHIVHPLTFKKYYSLSLNFSIRTILILFLYNNELLPSRLATNKLLRKVPWLKPGLVQ
jgi:hypothetical protein